MSQPHVSTQDSSSGVKKWQMPDTLILIFIVGLLAAAMTYLIPVGQFDSQQVSFMADGVEKSRTVINPESFRYVTDESGEMVYNKVQFFASGGGIGLMNFPFEGLVSGSKWGSAIGVIMFMLIIGGAFGIVMRTGTIDNGILKLIDKTKGSEALFIPALFLLFSLGGAVFGMGEEAVAFAIIIAPLMVRLGYDGITTVMGDLRCNASRLRHFLDEPFLCRHCTRHCGRSRAVRYDDAHGNVGCVYPCGYRLHHDVRVAHQSEPFCVLQL